MDWSGLEAAAAEHLMRAVTSVRTDHPDENIYGAAFYLFYAETDGLIRWPLVGVGTRESFERVAARYRDRGIAIPDVDLRWSPADMAYQVEAESTEDDWADRVTAEACRTGSTDHWEATYLRFEQSFAHAAKTVRGQLPDDLVVVAIGEETELIPLILTPDEMRRHFPSMIDEAETP